MNSFALSLRRLHAPGYTIDYNTLARTPTLDQFLAHVKRKTDFLTKCKRTWQIVLVPRDPRVPTELVFRPDTHTEGAYRKEKL